MKSITFNTSVGKITFRKGDDRNVALRNLQKALIALEGVDESTPLESVITDSNNALSNLEYLAIAGYESQTPGAFEIYYKNVIVKIRGILRSHGYKSWDKI